MMTVLFVIFLILSFPFQGVALTLKASSKVAGVTSKVTNTTVAKPLRRRAFKATTKAALEKMPKLKAVRTAKAASLQASSAAATGTVVSLKASQVALVAASLAAKALSAFFKGASTICSWLIPIDIYITIIMLVVILVAGVVIVIYYGDEAEEQNKEENGTQEESTAEDVACIEEDIDVWIAKHINI